MKPKQHVFCKAILGENQDGVLPLPAFIDKTNVVCCFELDEEERKRIAETGEIWVSLLHHNYTINPIFLTTKASDVLNIPED